MPDCLLHGSCNPAGNWYKDAPRGIAVSTVKGSNEEWQGGIGRHKMLWHEVRDRYFLPKLHRTVETAGGKAFRMKIGVMQRSRDIAEGETLYGGDIIQAVHLSWERSNQCTVIWEVYVSQSQVIRKKACSVLFFCFFFHFASSGHRAESSANMSNMPILLILLLFKVVLK